MVKNQRHDSETFGGPPNGSLEVPVGGQLELPVFERVSEGNTEEVPRWAKAFDTWSQEMSSALVPLRTLQEDLEYYSEQEECPRLETIRAEVRAAMAMMPLLKVILHEMQNWPDRPVARKPREKKDVKKK